LKILIVYPWDINATPPCLWVTKSVGSYTSNFFESRVYI
jgi:hypothetical protein